MNTNTVCASRNFRVDRMAHLNDTGHPRMGKELFTKDDLGPFNMYSGKAEKVTRPSPMNVC